MTDHRTLWSAHLFQTNARLGATMPRAPGAPSGPARWPMDDQLAERPTRSLQKGVGTMPGRLGRFVFLGEARDCVEGRDRREGRGVTLAGRDSDRPQSRTAPWGRSGSGFERLESVARAGRGEGPQRGLRRPQDQTRARSLGYRGTQGLRCGSRAPPRPCSRPNPAHVLRRQAPPGETPDSGPQTSPSHTAPPRSMRAGEGRKDWT